MNESVEILAALKRVIAAVDELSAAHAEGRYEGEIAALEDEYADALGAARYAVSEEAVACPACEGRGGTFDNGGWGHPCGRCKGTGGASDLITVIRCRVGRNAIAGHLFEDIKRGLMRQAEAQCDAWIEAEQRRAGFLPADATEAGGNDQ